MAQILLARTYEDVPNGNDPYAALELEAYYDEDMRGIFRTEPKVVYFPFYPYEIDPSVELDRFCEGGTTTNLVVVRSPLNPELAVHDDTDPAGHLQLQYIPDPVACPLNTSSLTVLGVTVTNETVSGARDGKLAFEIQSAAQPIIVQLPGRPLLSGGTLFDTNNPAAGYIFNGEFTGLPQGYYRLHIEDASGTKLDTGLYQLGVGASNPPTDGDINKSWLRYAVTYLGNQDTQPGDPDDAYFYNGQIWEPRLKVVANYSATVRNTGVAPAAMVYSRPVTELVDAYYLPDNRTYRQVRHDGNGGVKFTDTVPVVEVARGQLRIVNIIKTDVDKPGTPTGSLWVEADSPAPPYRFRLVEAEASNLTGQFSNLAAAEYTIEVTDAENRFVSETIRIEDGFRVRWVLNADDEQGNLLRYEILQQRYAGEPITICGDGAPASRGWSEGGSDPGGAIPEVVGSSVKLSLRTSVARQFQDIALGHDRKFRVDAYRGNTNELVFRGYCLPDTYSEPLLSGGQVVTLTAADGLGGLKETAFLNHKGESMEGIRRPLLSTILHCLSRTDTNLPLHVGVNLRDVLMAADSDPLLEAWGRRDAYADEGKEADCRTVLNGILKTFYALLVQKRGAWWILALNEVDTEYALRSFAPNGEALISIPRPNPWHLRRAGRATVNGRVEWREGSQRVDIVGAAKYVVSTVKLQFVDNQLPNGDFQRWKADLTSPLEWANDGLNLERFQGEKAGDYVVRMPASATDTYNGSLLSPPMIHQDGADESPVLFQVKAKVEESPITALDPKPEANLMRLRWRVEVDGEVQPNDIVFEFTSADKESEQEVWLPINLEGKTIRFRLLPPEHIVGGGINAAVQLLEVKAVIYPALVKWPETDHFTALNPRTAFQVGSEVELVHADLPRLLQNDESYIAVAGMDVYAWRHALSLADGRATTEWKRPDAPTAYPLLETSALDRLALLAAPVDVLVGQVTGPDVWRLGMGDVIDAIDDAPGRFLVVSCQHQERRKWAQVSLRKLSNGDFTDPDELPERVRMTHLGPRRTHIGYRVA